MGSLLDSSIARRDQEPARRGTGLLPVTSSCPKADGLQSHPWSDGLQTRPTGRRSVGKSSIHHTSPRVESIGSVLPSTSATIQSSQ
jgi:hypothetical protein